MRQETGAISMIPGQAELETLKQIATMIVKSGLAPSEVGTVEKAVIIMLKARELGVPPMQALSTIYVVSNKPTLSADLMVALLRREGHKVWVTKTDAEICTMRGHRRGESEHTVELSFGRADAEKTGRWGKGTWAQYPAQMLYARCAARLCRMIAPDVLAGMYTPEEMGAAVTYSDDGGETIVTTTATEVRPTPAEQRQPTPIRPPVAQAIATQNGLDQNGQPLTPLTGEEFASWIGVMTGRDPVQDKSFAEELKQKAGGYANTGEWWKAARKENNTDPYRVMLKKSVEVIGGTDWKWDEAESLPVPTKELGEVAPWEDEQAIEDLPAHKEFSGGEK